MSAFVSKKYSWGSYGYNVKPEIVGKTIEKIEEEKGSVTAESFLDASRPVWSSTHSLFEWDDSVAAEKYRLGQAGRVISSLKVEIIPITKEEKQLNLEIVSDMPRAEKLETGKLIPAYSNVTKKTIGAESKGKYISTPKAMSQEETRKIILENAYNELRAFMRKYRGYSELATVFADIETFGEKLKEA